MAPTNTGVHRATRLRQALGFLIDDYREGAENWELVV